MKHECVSSKFLVYIVFLLLILQTLCLPQVFAQTSSGTNNSITTGKPQNPAIIPAGTNNNPSITPGGGSINNSNILNSGSQTFNPYSNNGISNSNIGSIGQLNGGGSSCGLQTYLNAGVNGNSSASGGVTNLESGGASTTTGTTTNQTNINNNQSSFSLSAGVIWNQNPCVDQNKIQKLQIQNQTEQTRLQTQSQRDVACIQQRGVIIQNHPETTKENLDKVCELAPITRPLLVKEGD
jgi:hypothetical protein